MAQDVARCEPLCLDLPRAEAARGAVPAGAEVEAMAQGARALGDATRLAVAIALDRAGRACVCDLGWIVGRDKKLVSHHVRQLRSAGLARSERHGKMVMYELTGAGRSLVGALAAARVG